MKRRVCVALLVAGCASSSGESADESSSTVADTGTEATTLTTSMSDTAPTATTDDPTLTTSMSMSESESETETLTSETESTTGPTGCVSNDECTDPTAPICQDMVCTGCTSAPDGDAACAEKDANAAVCRDDGACVQCTPTNASACGDVTPLCDDGTSSCVGCTYHEQCLDSGACRIATGGCFDAADVYDVGQGQTYATIDAAVTALGEGTEVVLVLHGGPSFDEGVTLSGNGTAYAFISTDEPSPQWIRSSGMGPTLRVEGGAEAYVQNVRFTLNGFAGAAAIQADGGRVYLDRAGVVNNDGGGIALTGGAYAQVRNCFVGGDVSDIAAVSAAGSTVDVLYSTLGGGFGTAAALRCDDPSTVSIQDSLLVARTDTPELDCVAESVVTSATEGDVGDMNVNWFAGYANGNFGLTGMAPRMILDAAQWNTGDPDVDIDGDLRPTENDTPDVAGADVP